MSLGGSSWGSERRIPGATGKSEFCAHRGARHVYLGGREEKADVM